MMMCEVPSFGMGVGNWNLPVNQKLHQLLHTPWNLARPRHTSRLNKMHKRTIFNLHAPDVPDSDSCQPCGVHFTCQEIYLLLRRRSRPAFHSRQNSGTIIFAEVHDISAPVQEIGWRLCSRVNGMSRETDTRRPLRKHVPRSEPQQRNRGGNWTPADIAEKA